MALSCVQLISMSYPAAIEAYHVTMIRCDNAVISAYIDMTVD